MSFIHTIGTFFRNWSKEKTPSPGGFSPEGRCEDAVPAACSEREDTKIRRIGAWVGGKGAGPWAIQLQPTDRCNLACPFCWRHSYGRENEELSTERWVSIAREACEMGAKFLTIVGGGEPLVRPDTLIALMEEIKRHPGVEGCMVTNGTIFTEKMVEKMVRLGWDGLSISIHADNPQVDGILRGSAWAFHGTLRGLERINKWKAKLGTDLPRITFHIVITKYNYDLPVRMVEMAHHYNVEIILLRLVNEGPVDKGKEGFSVLPEQVPVLLEQLEEAQKRAERYGIMVKREFNLSALMNRATSVEEHAQSVVQIMVKKKTSPQTQWNVPCAKPFSEMVILADGTVHPCCVISESNYKRDGFNPGDYLETVREKGLKEVWNSPKFAKIRSMMISQQLPPECAFYCTEDMMFREASGVIYEKRW